MRIVKNGDVHVSAPLGTSRQTVMDFIERNRNWISQARKRMEQQLDTRADFYAQLPLATKAEREEATLRMEALIQPLVNSYAKTMGVHPRQVSYKAIRSYWGKCLVKTHDIIFSYYLLLMPEWCVEQVVVHELAHLIVANHGPRFHALMDRYFPRWREARAEMRRVVRA
ncbi:MAG: DUF45 domain-containing protein [Bacteroidaceae bacterium]|nr:DUF45 domain-containing protein [Bacteroidaceae bacterium]